MPVALTNLFNTLTLSFQTTSHNQTIFYHLDIDYVGADSSSTSPTSPTSPSSDLRQTFLYYLTPTSPTSDLPLLPQAYFAYLNYRSIYLTSYLF